MTDTRNQQLAPGTEAELKGWLDVLRGEGKQVEATSTKIDIHSRPAYYDEMKYNEAQKAVNKYFTAISVSSTVGLILLVQLEEILVPLLKSGNSRTVVDLWNRYTATAMYILKCYENNIFDPESDGWRYVNIVRSMHQRAHKLMNSPECETLAKPKRDRQLDNYVWVNQYDMAVTQFAFIGLLILSPKRCGAYHITEEDLAKVVYFWRLLSHQLGIEDRFNLFGFDDDMPKQMRLLEMILEEYKTKLRGSRDQTGLAMARGILLAFEDLSTESTFNIFENHWLDVVSLSGSGEPAAYGSLAEWCKLIRFKLIFRCLIKSEFVAQRMNKIYKKKFIKFCKKGDKIKKKLSKKYSEHIYDLDASRYITA